MRVLVVIPARGGSKSIPLKNLAMVGGKPLIDWTLELLPHLDLPDFEAIVSTDSQAIGQHCNRQGVKVLHRPDYLATDDATTLGVLQHVAEHRACWHADAILCLQPTNPLRTQQDISAVYRIMVEKECDTVTSWTDSDPYEEYSCAVGLKGTGVPGFLSVKRRFIPRQRIADRVKPTGEIYLIKKSVIQAGEMEGNSCWAYHIPRERAWNIDEPCDIPIVEGLLRFNGRL